MTRATVLLVSVLLTLLALAGCNNVELRQSPDVARILVTHEAPVHRSAAEYIPMILPYALIAEMTYRDDIYQNFKPGRPVDGARLSASRCDGTCFVNSESRRILSNWRLVYAKQYPFATDHDYVSHGGLDVQIWVTRGSICRRAVIAFRGTDRRDWNDLVANVHWLGRLVGVNDEYKKVGTSISELVDEVQELSCYRPESEIITVGHSLGGGLAQHANFIDPRIQSVVVFDPSFVTGSWEIPKRQRDQLARGELVTRVYEHGEILAYPRFVLRNIAPTPEIDPRIENVRFNVVHGNVVGQHRLAFFDTCLMDHLASARSGASSREIPLPKTNGPDGMSCE